jgi:heat shock protein HslJ
MDSYDLVLIVLRFLMLISLFAFPQLFGILLYFRLRRTSRWLAVIAASLAPAILFFWLAQIFLFAGLREAYPNGMRCGTPLIGVLFGLLAGTVIQLVLGVITHAVLATRRRHAIILAVMSVALISASFRSAAAQKSSSGNPLSGTSWQLVKFQGPDEKTFTPDDKSKYTIKFGSNGRVVARVDCNRASSTWKATASGELDFGSWSRTSARCGPGSLHDQIVTEGAAVRTFAIKGGHLFLSGMESGGYYELEPLASSRN